jgi:hypothetical protein
LKRKNNTFNAMLIETVAFDTDVLPNRAFTVAIVIEAISPSEQAAAHCSAH